MTASWQRYLRDHPRAVDRVLAVLVFVAAGPASRFAVRPAGWWPVSLCAAISGAALLWRRTHPREAVIVTGVCAVILAALGYLLNILLLAPLMVTLYTIADRADRRTARLYTAVAVAAVVVTAVIAAPPGRQVVLETIGPIAWLLIPAGLGYVARLRTAYLEAMQARAEYAEQTREDEARRRVADERVRIARELHDVVAHHLALANAQASGVAHLLHSHPDEAEKMVNELAGTTSSALRELKATVGLLRLPDDTEAPLEPAPGLDRVPELVEAFTAAGLAVAVSVEGHAQRLSPGVDLTCYRVVQESLTNVAKHASAGNAEVRLVYTRDRLRITVTDDGGGASAIHRSSNTGFGLIGMRERVQSVGGTLRTGPRPTGGFEVVAELPLYPVASEEGTLP
ncbi:sensor histidine kinase [Catenulispora rubra]|uniref:sensor histidine kinase n=1 Tax=Catenulispora rubra TaxID=280293 RepID=UPI001891F424|nr:sensor histidine kinase [Catenulispora rubra]